MSKQNKFHKVSELFQDHLRTVLEKKRNESKSLVPEESSVNEISDVGCSAGQIDEDQHGSRDCLIQVEDELEEVFLSLFCMFFMYMF